VSDERLDMPLAGLRAEIEAAGGPLSEELLPESGELGPVLFGPLAARGPRAAGAAGEYALLVESIFEGYLLHYGRGRILDPPDPDLRLLAGDYLYAFGLARLALLGDLDAVGELADLISLCARAHASASEEDERARSRLAAGLWALAALAIGAGSWPGAVEAKRRAQAEGPAASEHVLDVANERGRELGLERELGPALIGFERLGERRNGRRKGQSSVRG
jgi:hypothetical protein